MFLDKNLDWSKYRQNSYSECSSNVSQLIHNFIFNRIVFEHKFTYCDDDEKLRKKFEKLKVYIRKPVF